jgi:pSer/pThr/pTyr-binding forkhead associated (FHA) protein
MFQVILNITSGRLIREQPLAEGESFTIGRTDASSIAIGEDNGLSRRHATFHLKGGQAFVRDEGSTNGTFLNETRIGNAAAALKDGDALRIGNSTVVKVSLATAAAEPPLQTLGENNPTLTAPAGGAAGEPSLSRYLIPAVAVAIIVLCGVGYGLYKLTGTGAKRNSSEVIASSDPDLNRNNRTAEDTGSLPAAGTAPSPALTPVATKEVSIIAADPAVQQPVAVETPPPPAQRKLYNAMSDGEKNEFIKQRAQHIAIMMGKRPYAFTPESLVQIKFWLDAFARRAGNNRSGLWGGDTIAILQRGKVHAPLIIRSFKQFGVPYVVGLYIPFIETEYNNISSDNAAGAAGLFQFLGPTAVSYGVPASERTNVAKMAPAAARYFRDNILSFGDDSMSVALSIAGYNRAPESVKRDLRNVLNAPNNEDKERSFWTLIANQGKLDEFFQKENVNYVPRFFAAAIFGETPWAFGIDMRPLSTYTEMAAPEPSSSPAE